jgi:hypothetical protein
VRPVTQQFLTTVRGSHRPAFLARVVTTFQTGTQPTGTDIDIADNGGSVDFSASQPIRATLSLTTPTKWPLAADDLMAPYGNEIYVWRGVAYGNGQRELVGLGYYRINTPQQDIVPDGPVSITGSDRMAGVIDAEFLRAQMFSATMTRRQMSESLIQGALGPQALVEWDDPAVADAVIGRQVIAERDRYGTLKELVESVGKVAYFDYRGVCVIRTPPSLTSNPVTEIDAGRNGVLVDISRNLTREGVKNVVVAVGEAPDTNTPAYGTAADYGENSPTRYGGRFGVVPDFISSPLILSNSQAVTAATTRLQKTLGLPYRVNMGSVPNPAMEVEDIANVSYPDRARSRSLRTERHVLDTIKIPLGVAGGAMQMTTREQTQILIGEVAW